LGEVPVGAFAALVTALGLVLTLPVALGTIIYVWLDYVNARVAFGGADLIDAWLGWVVREPHTLLVVVPALGVLADAVVRTAKGRQPLRGVVLVGVGISLSVVASSVTQQAHVFALGDTPTGTLQSFVPYALFNLVPLLAPLIVVLLSLLALRAGTPGISGAFVAAFLGVGMIFTGLVGSAAMHLDALGLVGTVFGEATLVYVVYGAVLTAIVAAGAAMLMGSMLAMWLDFRAKAPTRVASDGVSLIKDWLKSDVAIPEVAATTLMITFVIACVMAQWAVYSARRGDKSHTKLALGITMFTGLAIVNAQIALWMQIDLVLRNDAYETMFYAITGTMMAII
ncbi:MAG: hypothetical protein EBT17_06295, partial [Actinobacteria bacterium]|nr:hypothetical protein [Actinomycetota bacterium]